MTKDSPQPKAAASGARVALDHETALEVGFFGVEADPTPDAHYTVAGVVAGKPTPETNAAALAAAQTTTATGKFPEKASDR
jgi:hypothetical protein